MRNIKQNLFFALVYNAAGVPVAAGILYPFLGILVSPISNAFCRRGDESVVDLGDRIRATPCGCAGRCAPATRGKRVHRIRSGQAPCPTASRRG
jgi:hypothetical protein